jgi:hypothetical protein
MQDEFFSQLKFFSHENLFIREFKQKNNLLLIRPKIGTKWY